VGFGGNQKFKIIGSGTIGNSYISTYLALVNFVILVMKWCLIRTQAQSSMLLTNPLCSKVTRKAMFIKLISLSGEKWLCHKRLGHVN